MKASTPNFVFVLRKRAVRGDDLPQHSYHQPNPAGQGTGGYCMHVHSICTGHDR